ncbi:TetR family transcriptional regulator [Phenylobacterium sp.]|uniref:TetR family transcriptional regulator n=1 Tax=Phenylobacterium sp. TaxID=1871053 RepID=UPI0035B14A4F
MENAHDIDSGPAARILAAGRERLAAGGFRDLTLRPLAEASGATIAALTYHFGAKGQLIERLVSAERMADEAAHQAFAARFAGLERLEPAALAAILEAYLDDAVARRVTSLIWCELVLAAGVDEEARVLVGPWIAARSDFWRAFFAGRMDEADHWWRAAFGYVTDETVHSLAQGDLPDYRLLRRMTLERLAGRGRSLGLSERSFFEQVVCRMDPALALPSASSGDPFSEKAQAIALAAGEVIVADGAQAVTHRAVGERANVPASSVAYHFRTRLDVVRAGLTVVYRVAQGRLTPRQARGDLEVFVARGTVSVALAAAREAELVPYAVDLRRLRGENLRRRLNERLGVSLDLAAAQAVSIARLGAILLSQAQGEPANASDLVEWLVEAAAQN